MHGYLNVKLLQYLTSALTELQPRTNRNVQSDYSNNHIVCISVLPLTYIWCLLNVSNTNLYHKKQCAHFRYWGMSAHLDGTEPFCTRYIDTPVSIFSAKYYGCYIVLRGNSYRNAGGTSYFWPSTLNRSKWRMFYRDLGQSPNVTSPEGQWNFSQGPLSLMTS